MSRCFVSVQTVKGPSILWLMHFNRHYPVKRCCFQWERKKRGTQKLHTNFSNLYLLQNPRKYCTSIVILCMDFFESNNILVDNQHGFRQKHSTETQLLSTIHDISSALNEKKASHLVILDFTKAFDNVPHERLLIKLHHYGITVPLNNWLRSFLTHRTQQTVCVGVSSPPQQVISGVPQETVLGPLLFLLYVNNLSFGLEC